MNKTTLFLLAIGAAVAYLASKVLGKPAAVDTSLAGRVSSTLGSLGNAALGTIPNKYGFKEPIAAVLGGNKSVTAAKSGSSSANPGLQASVDVSKALAAFLGLFKSDDTTGPHSTQEDYLAALAEAGGKYPGPDGSEYMSVNGQSVPANFSTNRDYREALAVESLDQFYTDSANAEPLTGYAGRNFSLEDPAPLNVTEEPLGEAYPPWSEPGGANFSFFTDPLGLNA